MGVFKRVNETCLGNWWKSGNEFNIILFNFLIYIFLFCVCSCAHLAHVSTTTVNIIGHSSLLYNQILNFTSFSTVFLNLKQYLFNFHFNLYIRKRMIKFSPRTSRLWLARARMTFLALFSFSSKSNSLKSDAWRSWPLVCCK